MFSWPANGADELIHLPAAATAHKALRYDLDKNFSTSLIALGGLSLLAAIWAGLVRMDWNLLIPNLSFPETHGPLMIVGFLGTVIGLERAVALKKPWTYGAPTLPNCHRHGCGEAC